MLLSIGEPAAEQAGRSDYLALMMGSVLGMVLLTQAKNMITFFVALETALDPALRPLRDQPAEESSLESGLKYLIIGSVGSATLLYGLALIYGASGSTDFPGIAAGHRRRAACSTTRWSWSASRMVAVGLAFKVSIAPFHQWTPDVYQGAPTPITALHGRRHQGRRLRRLHPLLPRRPDRRWSTDWDVARRARRALDRRRQRRRARPDSLKRMLGYSGIAQAGYMLCGIVVATQAGLTALVFYLAAYAL